MPWFLFPSCCLMKITEEFCNLPKAELILYFANYLPVKLFNCSFADLSKYSWFNRRFLLPWTLFRTFSSPRNGYNSMHNTKTGVIKKKMIYQSFWQMVFPVLRINAVAETLFAFMTFQGKDIPHLHMVLGLKSTKRTARGETSKEYRSCV